jgi:branched-chain amino acid transport system permease protein
MLLASGFTIFLQYFIDGLIKGTGYGILGLSFGLIVAVTTRFHFAWAICYAAAGFLAAWLQVHEGMSAWSACVVGLSVAAIVSVLVEFLIYRPLAVRSGSHAVLAVFVVGFGLTIFGENLIHLVLPTSSGIASESLTWIPFDFYSVGGVDFTAQDIAWVSILWFAAVVTWGLLRYTPLGRQINAVRVNPEMAEAVGIRKERTYLIVFALGAILAGLHSELFAMKFAATPEMGEQPLFYAFVVAFLAGLGKPPLWVMLVGTLLGVVESVSAEVVSVSWGQAVVFGILLVALVIRAVRVWRPRLFAMPNLALRFPPVRSE